jgi:hypothetical protein
VWWSKNAHFLAPELNDIYTANTTNELTTNNQNLTSHLLQPPPQQQQQQQSLSNNINNNSTTAVDIYAFGMVALEVFISKIIFLYSKNRLTKRVQIRIY